MKRCKTCKWWEVYNRKKDEWGSCGLADSNRAVAEYPQSLAIAQDYEAHMAYLETHRTFGCVQWERKE